MKYHIIVLLCAGMVSCTAPIDINVRTEDAHPVIYSTLTDQVEQQKVEVSRTIPYFSPETEAWVDDATVTVATSEGDTYTTYWNDERKAYFTTEAFSTVPDVIYTLTVEFDFDGDGTPDTYTATTSAKTPPATFESIAIEPYDLPMTDISAYMLTITGQDPPGRDFYIFRVEINGEIKGEIGNWLTVGDRMFQDSRIDDFPLGIFPGEDNEEEEDDFWFESGDYVRLLLSDVEMGFMRFVSEVQSSGGGANPMFGGPPYNMRTNISNGALGWFGSLCSLSLEATVPPATEE